MNSGDDWNNSYLLTVQLDNILTTKYPEMRSLFSVQLTASDSHVKEVIFSILFLFYKHLKLLKVKYIFLLTDT